MTPRHVAALAVIGAAMAYALTVYYLAHRHQRPPVPDVVAQVEKVERRVVYLIDLVAAGEGPRLCTCEPASRPEPRRAQR